MGSLTYPELNKFHSVQLSLNCLSGAHRHLLVPSQTLLAALRGEENLTLPRVETLDASYLYDDVSSTGTIEADPDTLRSLPWLTQDGQRVGGVLCHIARPPGQPPGGEVSPRAVALKQVARLKDILGLTIKSAMEAEFMISKNDETTSFNNFTMESYGRFDILAGQEEPLLETSQFLQEAGLPLESFMSELSAGQLEMTFRPQEGILAADTIAVMKDGFRANLAKYDLVPTFMTWPSEEGHANGFHQNHSLWLDGVSQFPDPEHATGLSVTARHWIAGLILHAPALTSLYCPTLNCFRRLTHILTPKTATWGLENRACFLRVKADKGNVYVENRLPSSACNPYLVLAGTLAAGIDGLTRKLECPPEKDPKAPEIPKTLEEATAALLEDQILIEALGKDFIQAYIDIAKRTLHDRVEHNLDNVETQKRIYYRHI